jgi:hypothetical protein
VRRGRADADLEHIEDAEEHDDASPDRGRLSGRLTARHSALQRGNPFLVAASIPFVSLLGLCSVLARANDIFCNRARIA